jgi:hypothetical protein
MMFGKSNLWINTKLKQSFVKMVINVKIVISQEHGPLFMINLSKLRLIMV